MQCLGPCGPSGVCRCLSGCLSQDQCTWGAGVLQISNWRSHRACGCASPSNKSLIAPQKPILH